jgi:DNA-binding transcriptional LysR family regulator
MTRIHHVDWAKHDPMDIRDLDYFLARRKAGRFTAAARDAYVVQSARSSAIARLERDLGGAAVRPGRHANSPWRR